ncbi:DNA polymerase III subunit epsilon [Fodinisporobacter ferrooxydans]|uniref:DNA polymerase III subunit epsilon n=1 Tax=Fodinisporobacter ferrooxydans TaxID=2901836 RepID=A0ABY4CRB6_9BACL|nr:DNA polymerase III subunit epsilon [Alicyclobacillaceae bacterium MYW30-H2]
MKWFWNTGRTEQDLLARQRELAHEDKSVTIWEMPLSEAEYFVIDIETSGFSATKDCVLSLAGGCMHGCDTTLDPLQYSIVRHDQVDMISDNIWQLTGLSPAQIQQGEEWRDVLFRALELSSDRVWIAHHIRHEMSFIQRHAKHFWKMHLRPIAIDTAIVAQALCKLPDAPTLDRVCEWLDVPVKNRHRADADIMMTAEVWKKEMAMCRSLGLETIGEVIEWSISHGWG